MIILDKPYVSRFMLETTSELGIPVLKNQMTDELQFEGQLNLVDDWHAVQSQRSKPYPHIYCNSENSLGWIGSNLAFSDLPQKIDLFKDKVKFRQLLEPIYPDYFYQAVPYSQLGQLDVEKLDRPFVIKPSVGFFSMGVHMVNGSSCWTDVLASIQAEIKQVQGLYPKEVMDSQNFIIEQTIEGDEYAVDAYFDQEGRPIILNIMHHIFSSAEDVSDRLYLISNDVIGRYYHRFYQLLEKIGELAQLRNFPMHIELRITPDDQVIPIEANPMRFAGWCTIDLAYHAHGINAYQYYFAQKEPDWGALLSKTDTDIVGLMVGSVPAAIDRSRIKSIDYQGFSRNISQVLELRPINYHEYPVFAFAFFKLPQTEAGQAEMDRLLALDFGQYINTAD